MSAAERRLRIALALTRRLGGRVTVSRAEMEAARQYSATIQETTEGFTVCLYGVTPATFEQRVLELADEDPEGFLNLISELGYASHAVGTRRT